MAKQLLLADDSVTIQKVVEITFADKDYNLTVADNGEEALSLARKVRPDLILADVFMPGMDGYQLCVRVHQDQNLAGVPVVFLAGTFEPFDEGKATAAGAAGWISKPFTSQDLVNKVEQILEQADAAPAWQATTSKSPSESVLNTFAQVAATDFASGRDHELSAEDLKMQPGAAAEPAPAQERASVAADASDFANGVRDDFTFEDLAASSGTQAPAAPVAPQALDSAGFEQDSISFDIEAESVPSAPAPEFSFETEPPEPEQKPIQAQPAAPAQPEVVSQPVAKDDTALDLPSLDEFIAPEPAAPAPQEIVDLDESAIVAEGQYAATATRAEARAAYLSDEELTKIVERVVGSVIERLAAPIMEKVVWEVVPDLAENMIRAEMDKIKQNSTSKN